MLFKKIKFVLILLLFYQTPLYSKSNSFEDFDSRNLSKYFSGIVAFGNKDNSVALDFFNSTKILIDTHDPYLKRYVFSLVLENKVSQAINVIKQNKDKNNTSFFDAYLLLLIDSLKKDNLDQAYNYLLKANEFAQQDRFDLAILESLRQYIYIFKEKKFLNDKKNLGKLSIISDTFQRCYLEDPKTDEYFSNLINNNESDFTRYIYFYLSYLIENDRLEEAKNITQEIEFINTTLLLSQGKSWIENENAQKLNEVFSCKNHNDLISEFLFLISNLYSSEDNFEKSNFYLNLSNFLNPKFKFNLSLVAENYFLNKDYEKAKKILKKFKKEENFYFWYRLKKEAQIIAKQRNDKESLSYITSNFRKIDEPNHKILFDIANFYKKSEDYKEAIKYYTKIISNLDDSSDIKSDILYRRGGSYERLKNYEEADKDLLHALKISPDDAYILNYLAYSWLERDYKINEAIEMLEIAYASKNNDPYIIDSIGWAYYLIDDYLKAEKFLKRAVELMPDDPIVNDHYGDILWKLDRKIQARYFWANVLKMDDAEEDMIEKINIKMIKGLKNS
ncbi:MAG: tetratricopeptide repeat protein [Candidatus Pelagibacter sp.]